MAHGVADESESPRSRSGTGSVRKHHLCV